VNATDVLEPPTLSRRGTVLVVDDEQGVRASIRAILEGTCEVLEAETGADALELLRTREVDLVRLDQRMPGEPGIDVLPKVKAADPSTVVVLANAVHDVRTAVEALKRGAYDYITKPFDVDDILMLVERALEKRALERQVLCLQSALAPSGVTTHDGFEGLVGRHPEMVRVYQLITQIAATPTTVLITGESGTGKELVARAVHQRSGRSAQPFVAINVAAIPEALIESELFGHEKGAFTGADKQRIGRFEQADGGTLFLDEIGDMSANTQAKILRVLQEHEFERLGGTRTLRCDVRVITATNRNLPQMVANGQFREDLYYRLNVVSIEMPPLRERKDDVGALATFFLRRFASELKKRVDGVSPDALKLLMRYNWPGNIRELENSIERAVLLCEGQQVTSADLRLGELSTSTPSGEGSPVVKIPPTGIALEEIERQALIEALKMSNWVQKDAAELLNISPRVMNYKIKTLAIEYPRGRRMVDVA
jgi:DNA-binding NtrC family response regulator